MHAEGRKNEGERRINGRVRQYLVVYDHDKNKVNFVWTKKTSRENNKDNLGQSRVAKYLYMNISQA